MYISKIKDEYFVDNMIIYIEKKITKKVNYNSIIDKFKNMKKDELSFKLV